MTNEDQDYEVMCVIRDVMRDISGDPKLDPPKVTKRGLKKQGLNDRTVDELMKLQVIYLEVMDGKPVDIKHLRAEIDAVMAELKRDGQLQRSERMIGELKDDVKHKKDDINKIKHM